MEDSINILEWVERLGGWAVVLLVVKWMMTRIDRTIQALEDGIKAFQKFEEDEDNVHEKIVDGQKILCQMQKEILRIIRQKA